MFLNLLPIFNILKKHTVYMQKLLLNGLILIGLLIILISINLNFYSNAMAIENRYLEEHNNRYNNNYQNDDSTITIRMISTTITIRMMVI